MEADIALRGHSFMLVKIIISDLFHLTLYIKYVMIMCVFKQTQCQGSAN